MQQDFFFVTREMRGFEGRKKRERITFVGFASFELFGGL